MATAVLIVDDDPGLCETLLDILEANDYAVESANNGRDAIALCQKNRYDVALVDIKLPDISGPEVVKKMVEISPKTDFIYITAYASLDTTIAAVRQKHVVSYETKPLDMDRLLSTIRLVSERKQAEDAQRESEERYRSLVDTSPDAIVITDLETKVFMANQQALKLYGFEREEDVVGKSGFDMVAPEDHERAMKDMVQTLKEEIARNMEYTFLRKDGSGFIADLSVSAIKDREGTPKFFVAVVRDITDRKRAEEALRESEKRYRLLAENVTDVIWTVDMNLGFSYISPSIKALRGYTAQETMAQPLDEVLTPESFRLAMELFEKERENIEKGTLQPQTLEIELICQDGSTVQAESKISVVYDENRKPVSIMGVTRDITERKRAEEELRIKDSAIASSINAIGITDLELNLTYINNSFLELWGYEEEKEVLGRPAAEFWQARRTASEIVDVLQDRGSWIGELVAERKDGSLFDAQVSASMVTGEAGKPLCIMASFVDITERKRAEEQLQETNRLLVEANRRLQENQQQLIQSEKMASIGQLSAGVAHEINNPLSFIMSNLKALQEYVETFKNLFEQYDGLSAATQNRDLAKQTAVLEHIEQIREQENLSYILKDIAGLMSESIEGTERIHEVVRNLKSFARPDEAQINEADINNCIESTLKIVGNELKYKCTVNKYLNPLPSIYCYPGQLNQVFMNLLVNAAHAIPERGEITITTESADSHIVIKISDTGEGIPPENLSRIFDPFFTTKEVGKGTGLGLPISHRIIQKHGGTIEVESEVGKGTTFTIRLPIEAVPE